MKRFTLWSGLTVGILLSIFIIAYLILSSLLDSQPYISDHSYVELSLVGAIPEYQVPDFLDEQFFGREVDMKNIRQIFSLATMDPRIKGIILKPSYVQIGYAKLQEIIQLIGKFQASGKQVIAIMDVGLTRDYLIASACDSIFLKPEGMLLLTGMAAEITFYKDLLKKIGVEADFEHIGRYKSYPETYTSNRLSDTRREVINDILDHRYRELIDTISKNRNMTASDIENKIDAITGFTPEEAINHGLVDDIKNMDDVKENFKDNEGVSAKRISAWDYTKVSPSSIGIERGPAIAVIYCTGSIMGGEDGSDPIFGSTMGANRVVRDIRRAEKNTNIQAIVLRINSPGGSGIASEKIWHAIKEAAKTKPVIASVSDIGASGGYYIALAADTIIAQRASLVGSIGVFIGKFSLNGLYAKLGINVENIKRGKNALMFSLNSKFSESERAVVRKMISDNYDDFVQKIANSRNIDKEKVLELATGRVWSGKKCKEFDLIDELGGLSEAIIIAQHKAKIDSTKIPSIVYFPKQRSIFRSLSQKFNFWQNPIDQAEDICRGLQLQPLYLVPYKIKYF